MSSLIPLWSKRIYDFNSFIFFEVRFMVPAMTYLGICFCGFGKKNVFSAIGWSVQKMSVIFCCLMVLFNEIIDLKHIIQ